MTLSMLSSNEISQYQLSSAVSITEQQNGGCLVKHKISNKAFSLGPAECQAIKYFTENVSSSNDDTSAVNEQLLSAVIKYLAERDILVIKGQTLNNTFSVYPQALKILEQGCNLFELKPQDACFIGIPYSNGNANGSGCDKAPLAIREWMKGRGFHHKNLIKDYQLNKYLRIDQNVDFTPLQQRLSKNQLHDVGDFYIYPYEDNSKIFDRLKSLSHKLATKNVTPIFFGGDHSVSYPILQGLNDKYDNIYVIHIDAHTDRYHSEVDQLHIDSSVNHHGNFLSKSLNTLDNIKHVYQYGIRGINNIGTSIHPKVTSLGIGELLSMIEDKSNKILSIPAGANVYLSLDVDVLDPSVFPATNSPIPGGLLYHELLSLLAIVLNGQNLIGADLVEFNPARDRQEISHQIFSELMIYIANFIGDINHD